jgi:hypothetical protein
MSGLSAILVVVLFCSLCGGVMWQEEAPAGVETPERKYASAVTVREGMLTNVAFAADDGNPANFTAKLTLTMPTPGYEFTVDEVTKPDGEGRILARVTAKAPEGMVIQVLSEESLDVKLGALHQGEYLLELWVRSAPDMPYQRAGAAMLAGE